MSTAAALVATAYAQIKERHSGELGSANESANPVEENN